MANKKKKEFFLVRWFKRVFLGTDREVRSILEEEQVQTPLRTVVHNFVRKKSAMLGVVVFLCIFALVIIGPYIWKLDLSEQDSTLINLPPGYNMMSLPKETEGKVSDIAAGRTYGIGVDTDGHVYTWGHTRITDKIDIADIPEEVQEADLSLIAAGDDHAVALDENGQLYVWGNTRLRQDNFSRDMEKGMETGENWDIIQLEASNQFSAAVSSEGTLYLWGNPNMADVKIRSEYQGNIAKVALTANEYVSLLKDGTVAYTGYKGSGNPLGQHPRRADRQDGRRYRLHRQDRRGADRGRRSVCLGQRDLGRSEPAGIFVQARGALRRPVPLHRPAGGRQRGQLGQQQIRPDGCARLAQRQGDCRHIYRQLPELCAGLRGQRAYLGPEGLPAGHG